MARTVVVSALFAILLIVPRSGVAQSPAVIDDPEATVVADLIVRAPTPGPAWWRVSRGDSVVWILGMPSSPTPKTLAWDQSVLERRLSGAHALLLPPRGSVRMDGKGEVSVLRMLPGLRRMNGDVEKAMPAPLAQRFNRVRTRLKKPVSRYAFPIPLISSFMLYGDFTKSAGLSRSGVWSQAESAAGRARVKSVRPQTVTMGTISPADWTLERPEAAACMEAMLDSAEVPVERYRAAAAGWASGDVAAAISAPREPFSICENRMYQQGFTRRSIAAQTAAIEAALKRPGKTVAFSHLRTLVAQDGILQRLAAAGYEISDPVGAPVD